MKMNFNTESFNVKSIKKFSTLLLVGCILLGLAACGGEQEISAVSLQGRLSEAQIYYATDLELQLSSNEAGVDFKVYGSTIYYPEGQAVETYSAAEGQTVVDAYAWTDAPGAWNFEKVSYSRSGELYGLVYVEEQTADKAGADVVTDTLYLCKFDAARSLMFAKDLREYAGGTIWSGTSGIYALEVGTDDSVYISNSTGICIFEADGEYRGEVSFGSVKEAAVLDFLSDGDRNLYVLYSDAARQSQYVAEIDTDKAAVKNVQQTIGLTGLGTTAMDGDILGFNQATVYLYSRKECALYELFPWTECGLNGNEAYRMHYMSDGSIFVAVDEADEGAVSYLVRERMALESGNSGSGKIDIVIGHSNRDNLLAVVAAGRFNNTSEKYHVVVENYSWAQRDEQSMARLDSLFASGAGPDILDLSLVDVDKLVEYGYLEDLTLYLEGSSEINTSDFLDFALEEYQVDGMLLAIPHHFKMSLMVANSDFMGTEPGWTLEEALTLLEESGETQIFAKEMRRRDLFEYLLYMNEDLFVDREAGTCDFDNALFRRIVELAEVYPTQYKAISDKEKEPLGLYELENGSGVMCSVTGEDFQFLQPYEGALVGKINYIGYPDEDGTGVSACDVYDAFGISSLSDCKEGAWEFLEFYIQFTRKGVNLDCFPTYRPAIQELVNWTMESGLSGVTGKKYYGYEMWGFQHYLPGQEEMDTFCELLERAQPERFDKLYLEAILEELEGYYNGEVSIDIAIKNIENRVRTYLAE